MSQSPVDRFSEVVMSKNLSMLDEFLETTSEIKWFSETGKPNARDFFVKRILDWDEWNGPESELNSEFSEWLNNCKENLLEKFPDEKEMLESIWESTEKLVFTQAIECHPLYDSDEDAWHGPTLCVWAAAFTFCLISWHFYLGLELPDRLADEMYWYSSGHWPCDYAQEPVYDMTKGELHLVSFKLVVL